MAARLPDQLKKLRGTLQRSRSVAARPARGSLWIIGGPASGLPLDVQQAWRDLAADVNASSTASTADLTLFGETVRALVLSRRAWDSLERDGFSLTSASGAAKANPAVGIYSSSAKLFAALSAKFGIGPAERERSIALASEEPDTSPLAEFSQRRGAR